MRKIILFLLVICCTVSCLAIIGSNIAQAQTTTQTTQSTGAQPVDLSKISPVSGSVPTILGNSIKVLLGVVGALALIMFIYGGMYMLTSHGNPEMVKKGKEVLIWAIIGLIVIFGSYVFVGFIITAITGGTTGTTSPTGASQQSAACGQGNLSSYSCVDMSGNSSINPGDYNCLSGTTLCPNDPNYFRCCIHT